MSVFLNRLLRGMCFVPKTEEVGEKWRISEDEMGGKYSTYAWDGE